MIIITGGIVFNNDKYLLVQERKETCYGKWNLPAGRLDSGESIKDGAIREIKEETGYDVELSDIIQIGDRNMGKVPIISFIFLTKILDGSISFDQEELLDVKWFSYEEIVAMEDNLRSPDLIMGAIENHRQRLQGPVELIKTLR